MIFFLIGLLSIGTSGYFGYVSERTALEEESFKKLRAIRELKGSQIERYFQLIRNQIETFSENQMIIDAMKEFKESFKTVDSELELDETELATAESNLEEYYDREFLTRLNPNLAEKVGIEEYWPPDKTSLILQDLYISSNSNPTGSKAELNAATDGSLYSSTHGRFHPIIKNYLEKFGYYDIFLVDSESGHIVYSVFKEVDYTTSLLTGPYKDTNFAKAFGMANRAENRSEVQLVDFEPYHPSYNAAASFIASPIFDGSTKVGILIFQMPLGGINKVMTSDQKWSKVGLGESGETYLVGEDFKMKSQSRFLIEDSANYFKALEQAGLDKSVIQQIKTSESSIGLQPVKTKGSLAAVLGKTEEDIFEDYRGVRVLSSYKPLAINGVKWVLLSEIDESEAFAAISELRNTLFLSGAFILLLTVLGGIGIATIIAKPLNSAMELAAVQGQGDFSIQTEMEQTDEVGLLVSALNKTSINLSKMIGEVDTRMNEFNSSMGNLGNFATEMSTKAEDSVLKANTVSSAAEEMTTNMLSVASAMEESTTNVNAIVAAAEEISSGINEISQKSDVAKNSTTLAVEQAIASVEKISELGKASEEIGTVSETIASISEKTNLLALNATIEAARAGEAGKGFAVVASEIKELSQQTAGATKDIATKLKAIQQSTSSSISDISEIEKRIIEVNEIVSAISSSVDQQDKAISEITKNVSQTSLGLKEVSENASQTTQAATQIAKEISEVNDAANDISNSSSSVRSTAEEFGRNASEISGLLGRFKIIRS